MYALSGHPWTRHLKGLVRMNYVAFVSGFLHLALISASFLHPWVVVRRGIRVHPSTRHHSGCFCIVAGVSSAGGVFTYRVLFARFFPLLSDVYVEPNGIAGSYGQSICQFLRNSRLPPAAAPAYPPPAVWEGGPTEVLICISLMLVKTRKLVKNYR